MLRVIRPLLLGRMLLSCNPFKACLVDDGVRRRRRGLHGGVIVPGDQPSSSASASASAWRKPEAGRLKLNFDGSSKHASRRASIGGVYRDHEGGFVLGYAERLVGTATSSVAELAALRRGLELAVANGWRSVWIEGDAKAVVDAVRGRALVRAEEDRRLCVEIVEALLPMIDDVSVSHVRRRGNRVAHGFARLGHGAERPRVWRDVPPDEVLGLLRRDAEGN